MSGSEKELSSTQKQQVIDAVSTWLKRANCLYLREFPPIEITFDLRGHTAGMFCRRHERRWLRFNNSLFAHYFLDNLAHTVPHEVAHYVAEQLHPRQRIRPHGLEWQEVMYRFGVPANRTCAYDLSQIKTRQYRTFPYQCRCRVHQLTAIRHNKILTKQRVYLCRVCGDSLVESTKPA